MAHFKFVNGTNELYETFNADSNCIANIYLEMFFPHRYNEGYRANKMTEAEIKIAADEKYHIELANLEAKNEAQG